MCAESVCALSLSKRAKCCAFDRRRPELVEGLRAHDLGLRAHDLGYDARAARRISAGNHDGQRGSASRSLRAHQPTSASSYGAFT
jgi:hypothetical protein